MAILEFPRRPADDVDDTAPYDRRELAERFLEQFVIEAGKPPRRGFRVWLSDLLDDLAVRIWEMSEKIRRVNPRGGA